MFGTIRKHQQWLWAIIITLTIISFVIYFGPASKVNNAAGSGANFGVIGGEKITREDYKNAQYEILLQYFFMSGGNWYTEAEAHKQNFDLDQRTYGRLLIIQKQEQSKIRVSSDMAGQFATQMLRQFERNNPITPEVFLQQVLKPHGLTVDDFDRFVRHELGLQELMATIGTSGRLVTAQEAQDLYRREYQEIATEAVIISASNYLAGVTVTPDAVGQFYTNQMSYYRLPVRMQVAYVKYAYSNYYAKAEQEITNLNERVDAAIKQMGTNTFKDAKTPEENRAKVREEFLRMGAAPKARNEANEFARPLFENTPLPLADFAKLAKTNGLELAMTEPFGREETPKGLDVSQEFAKAAFTLSETEQPYAQPIIGRDGIYVIAFNKQLPSEVPALDQIRERVTADYRLDQAIMQAIKTGIEFSQKLTNGLAAGKTFGTIAAEAKLKVVDLPPVSLAMRELPALDENVPLDLLKELVLRTPPGSVSPYQRLRQGGIVVHVKYVLPLDEAMVKANLPGFTASVRQTRQREAFESWFRKEAQRSITDAPILQQKQKQQGGAAAGS